MVQLLLRARSLSRISPVRARSEKQRRLVDNHMANGDDLEIRIVATTIIVSTVRCSAGTVGRSFAPQGFGAEG